MRTPTINTAAPITIEVIKDWASAFFFESVTATLSDEDVPSTLPIVAHTRLLAVDRKRWIKGMGWVGGGERRGEKEERNN
jgi:hypothetical protein